MSLPAFTSQRSLYHRKLFLFRLAGLLLLLSPAPLHATIFDWPSSGWTGGVPAPGQTVTQSFTSVTPNNITVSINNNGASNQGATWQTGYPAIDSTTETGGFNGTNGLQLFVIQQSSTSSYIKMTVTFSSAVSNLSFQIWDVDAGSQQFVDKIFQIQAIAVGGATVGPDSVTSAVPGFNSITGSGINTIVLGTALANDTTNQGTINMSFLGPITQFSFQWSNNDPNLGAQAIALGPLSYVVVPEPFSGWGVAAIALFCGIAIAVGQLTERKKAH